MTMWGQIFTIAYAFVAISTLIVMLANVGSGLASAITYTYRCDTLVKVNTAINCVCDLTLILLHVVDVVAGGSEAPA